MHGEMVYLAQRYRTLHGSAMVAAGLSDLFLRDRGSKRPSSTL